MTTEERAVLEANEAFYAAFRSNDAAAMDAVWARSHESAVIHPGWPELHGRAAVMQSWRDIMEGAGAPHVQCGGARPYVLGDAAFVICREHLPDGDLVATNVFYLEAGAWRMVHHQAGPVPPLPLGPAPDVVH